MEKFEGWGFLSMIGGLVAVVLALLLLEGGGQTVGILAGVALCVLSGGLYAVAGGKQRSQAEQSATANDDAR